ncbi:MAG TPA: sugar ABC transporter ATP-binding protein [Candidatus Baltobacteraceae bacterium]|nr:sugar ABC transporter ATP-binding protein [Candidatus Baltobacteraceae bacterium]
MNPVVLQAENITKNFPGVVALKDVSFDLRQGEIHGLCGENGAGKSTLIKLVSGIYPHGSYEGDCFVHGQLAKFRSLADAQKAGIAVIYQELALVNDMTVGENIFLGSEPRTTGGLIDWHKVYHEARVLLRKFNVEIDPSEPVAKLGMGQKQLVEIVKALSKDSNILILDEPTAALAEHEVLILLDILRDLRSRGIASIYISHKLDELFAVCDRITVLRDGSSIATLDIKQANKAEVIKHMVGREISDLFPRRKSKLGPSALEVENLTVADPHSGKPFLADISFSLRAGEVLGVGGLMGAGRTELLMHLFGAWGTRLSGSVHLNGREVRAREPQEIIRHGMVMVSEDRRRYGLILDKTIGFNLSLSSLAKLTKNRLIDQGLEFQRNNHFFQSLRMKAPTLEALVAKLSGGTQQKVVLGKALMTEPLVIFLDEPTRGIDVGAKLEIYETINQLTDAGKAVLLVSSELPELIGMSDRIVILHEGRIGGEFDRDEATQEKLLAAAMGQREVVLT